MSNVNVTSKKIKFVIQISTEYNRSLSTKKKSSCHDINCEDFIPVYKCVIYSGNNTKSKHVIFYN